MKFSEKLFENELKKNIPLKSQNNKETGNAFISTTNTKNNPNNNNNINFNLISDNSESPSNKIISINSTNQSITNKQQQNLSIFQPQKAFGEAVLSCNNISKTYHLSGPENEHVTALKSVTLQNNTEFYAIREGEFLMIRGPSGGGKTTFLNIIGSLDSEFEGELRIMDTIINSKCSDDFLSQMRLSKIGFVFQTFNLISTMTALENVELPMIIEDKASEAERRIRAVKLLSRVGLEDRLDHLPSELSGGEQQRVAIARALSNKPAILLLDEPTGDLDSASTVEIMNLLLDINNNRGEHDKDGAATARTTTIVMVTHNPELECYADRILYFEDGVIIKQILNEEQIELTVDEYLEYINRNM